MKFNIHRVPMPGDLAPRPFHLAQVEYTGPDTEDKARLIIEDAWNDFNSGFTSQPDSDSQFPKYLVDNYPMFSIIESNTIEVYLP